MNAHLNYESLLAQAKAAFRNLEFTPECPGAKTIVGYIYNELSSPVRSKISKHLALCESCRMLALKMEADRTELELMIDRSPEETLETIIGSAFKKDMLKKSMPAAGTDSPAISKIRKSLINWVSPIWVPQFAGQVVTAADIPMQSKQFEMDYGEYVNITCQWKGKEVAKASYLHLTWQANLHAPSKIWIRFIDPETKNILSECCLGTALEGDHHLTMEELGFDPSGRPWGIAVVTEEI